MGWYAGCTGKLVLPEENKKDFVKQMMKLLYYGGMMQIEEVKMYGKELKLLKPVRETKNEKIEFNFNYFEDNYEGTAGFDPKTCRFWTNYVGEAEFRDVVLAAYALYELCGYKDGYVVSEGKVVSINTCAGWINHLLYTEFSVEKRFAFWENAEKLAMQRLDNGCERPISKEEYNRFIPKESNGDAYLVDYLEREIFTYGTERLKSSLIIMEKGSFYSDVCRCRLALEKYLEEYSDEKIENLWELLEMNYKSRREIDEEELKDIAKWSLIFPARYIIFITSELVPSLDFWKEWKELRKHVYRDERMKKYELDGTRYNKEIDQKLPINPVPTAKYLRQEFDYRPERRPEEFRNEPTYCMTDDDRLYWWNGTDEVKISDEMHEWLVNLAKQHKELLETAERLTKYNNEHVFQKFFFDLLSKTDEVYDRVYVFESMFYEFYYNGNDPNYFAAVILLSRLGSAKENIEAARSMAFLTGIDDSYPDRFVIHYEARLKMKRYISVMSNGKLRKMYFGF